jgi:hypothetical protein
MSFNMLLADAAPADAARAAMVMAQDTLNDPKATETARQRAEEVMNLSLEELTKRIKASRRKRQRGGGGGQHRESEPSSDATSTSEPASAETTIPGDPASAEPFRLAVFAEGDGVILQAERPGQSISPFRHQFVYRALLRRLLSEHGAPHFRQVVLRSDRDLSVYDFSMFVGAVYGDAWTLVAQPALEANAADEDPSPAQLPFAAPAPATPSAARATYQDR